MKNLKKLITSPAATIALFVLAAVLLLVSTIGGIRAAFQAISEIYSGQMQMHCIGVTLQERCAGDENPRQVGWRNHIENSADKWDESSLVLLGEVKNNAVDHSKFLNGDTEFKPGKAYTEELSVANTGNIEEYVRVTIYKYWVDPDGNKVFLNETDDEGNEIVKEKDKKGKLIRQERYSGAMQRSFFVGKNVTEEDIKAKFEDGVLKLDIPKKEAPKIPEKKTIMIEG